MKKILIVGKKSFVASHIYEELNYKTTLIDYDELIKKKESFFKNFNYIINCSSNLNFIKKKYNTKFDYDYNIALKIKNLKCGYIFLSTRKVYFPKADIKETGKLKPKCNYSINKLTSENKVTTILNKKILILRAGNIIGHDTNKSKRKLHITFMDIFLQNIKNNILFKNPYIYKDFLPVKIFVKILAKLIASKCSGIYNVSFGKKIYIDNILNWLNYYNNKPFIKKVFKINGIKENKDCFYSL